MVIVTVVSVVREPDGGFGGRWEVGAPGSVVAERSLVQKERRMEGSTASGWRWHAVDVGLDLDERVVFFFFVS